MKIIVSNEQTRNRALTVIKALDISKPQSVEIKEHKADLSAQQRSYYWKIISIIANELGYEKKEMHLELKGKFLVPIFRRDDEGYAEMIAALLSARREMGGDYAKVRKKVVELTSITDCNVAQMSEYIDSVLRFATENGIRLPLLEDV